jgi:hypothetical protein
MSDQPTSTPETTAEKFWFQLDELSSQIPLEKHPTQGQIIDQIQAAIQNRELNKLLKLVYTAEVTPWTGNVLRLIERMQTKWPEITEQEVQWEIADDVSKQSFAPAIDSLLEREPQLSTHETQTLCLLKEAVQAIRERNQAWLEAMQRAFEENGNTGHANISAVFEPTTPVSEPSP